MGKEAAAGARSNEKERGERRGRIEVEGARTRRKIDREKSRHSVVAAEQQPMLAWKDGFLACSLASRLPFFFFFCLGSALLVGLLESAATGWAGQRADCFALVAF